MLRFLSKFINHSNWNNYLKYTNDTWVRVQHFAEKVKKEKRKGLLSIINFYFIIVNLVEQGTKQPLLR
jgi:RNA:NAD 2'-phosphotransferase (TPT1/KptA family)